VVSEAMRKAIELTNFRRSMQDTHNKKLGMTPKTVYSSIKNIGIEKKKKDYSLVDKKDLKKELARLELEMDIAAANMEYERAAELRDQIFAIKA
jgi:excinuclease ABC subunit B